MKGTWGAPEEWCCENTVALAISPRHAIKMLPSFMPAIIRPVPMSFDYTPMTTTAPTPQDTKSHLRKTMGFWDVLLFDIATVLVPRCLVTARCSSAARARSRW